MIAARRPRHRLAMALVTLAGVAVVVFVLLRVVPGDPIAMMISPGASAADIAALQRALRARRQPPDAVRDLGRGHALRGDFGTSISLHRDVLDAARRAAAGHARARDRGARSSRWLLGGARRRSSARWCGARRRSRSIDARQRPLARHARFRLGAGAGLCSSRSCWPLLPLTGRIDPSARRRL